MHTSYKSIMHLQEIFSKHQRVSREINSNTNSSVLISYLEANSVCQRSEKCVAEGSNACFRASQGK